METNQIKPEILEYSNILMKDFDKFRYPGFQSRHITYEFFNNLLEELISKYSHLIHSEIVGTSFEGRQIRVLKIGNGTIPILIWSQMHGDESTGTMAIIDILNYFSKSPLDSQTKLLLSRLTIYLLPMLNPDGAERFQRRSAQDIDINRDALALRTPEARILQQCQKRFSPHFAFNLHDQELSTVGTSKEISAIALLAPSINPEKTENDIVRRTKLLAATFISILKHFIPGKITRYDDTFEPRAFGDNMQRWGTSTLLIESGHILNDPEKNFIRRLNFTGILSTLLAIATDNYNNTDISVYENLPRNGKNAYDIIIRDVLIEHKNSQVTNVDLAISYQVDTHSESTPRLMDIGDLSTFIGLKEIEGKKTRIPQSKLKIGEAFSWEMYLPT